MLRKHTARDAGILVSAQWVRDGVNRLGLWGDSLTHFPSPMLTALVYL
jgi:hypothetical protein